MTVPEEEESKPAPEEVQEPSSPPAKPTEEGAEEKAAEDALSPIKDNEQDEPPSAGKENKKDDDDDDDEDDEEEAQAMLEEADKPTPMSSEMAAHLELIAKSTAETPLEIALMAVLKGKDVQLQRLTKEINKLRAFVSKRKQTYKRKRKDEGAPTRALSAYNIFIQDRFARLAKENENALKSENEDAQLKRVPPANLVASTGNEWKELSAEVKAQYEER